MQEFNRVVESLSQFTSQLILPFEFAFFYYAHVSKGFLYLQLHIIRIFRVFFISQVTLDNDE